MMRVGIHTSFQQGRGGVERCFRWKQQHFKQNEKFIFIKWGSLIKANHLEANGEGGHYCCEADTVKMIEVEILYAWNSVRNNFVTYSD